MFNYATYNGVPIITYGLIGLTASILGLVTLNPSILELNENGTQTTVSDAIGLDKISMPEFPSYLPGLNGLSQPFTGDKPDSEPVDETDDESDDESDDETDDESYYESEDDEPISDQSSVMNPLRKPSGGRKTRNMVKKNKKRRKTKRRK